MTTQTIISVLVWTVLTTSETILIFILTRNDKNIYTLYQRSRKCYYGSIVSVPDVRVLHMNQREKLGCMKILMCLSKSMPNPLASVAEKG